MGGENRRKVVRSRTGFAINCQIGSKLVSFWNKGRIRQRKKRDWLSHSSAAPGGL